MARDFINATEKERAPLRAEKAPPGALLSVYLLRA